MSDEIATRTEDGAVAIVQNSGLIAPTHKFWVDWPKTFPIVIYALKQHPVAGALLILLTAFSNLPHFDMWINAVNWVLQAIIVREIIIITYTGLGGQVSARARSAGSLAKLCVVGSFYLFCVLIMSPLFWPATWFAAAYAFAELALIIEGTSVSKAFKRSKQLTKGRLIKIISYVGSGPLGLAFVMSFACKLAAAIVFQCLAPTHLPVQAGLCVAQFFAGNVFLLIMLTTHVLSTCVFIDIKRREEEEKQIIGQAKEYPKHIHLTPIDQKLALEVDLD
jgi:hypothetical protein